MKKLVSATALVLTLAFGAGSVLAAKPNSNSSTARTGAMSSAKKGHKRHRRHHRWHRRHHKAAAKATH